MIIDRIMHTLTRRWLFFFGLVLALYAGLPILAPTLMNAGLTGPAGAIYRLYSPMCHQLASRSFFLFGEQVAYPRAIAGSDLTPIETFMPDIPEFAEASTDPAEWNSFLMPARRFIGNAQMGYKMALCQRDMGIYLSILAGGILYGLVRRRGPVRAMPFWLFLLVGVLPIGLDGFSQLFSQLFTGMGLDSLARLIPLRESTPLLRTLTGVIFGLSVAWLVFPRLDEQFTVTAGDIGRRLAARGSEPVDETLSG